MSTSPTRSMPVKPALWVVALATLLVVGWLASHVQASSHQAFVRASENPTYTAHIELVDVNTGVERSIIEPQPHPIQRIRWRPDGKELAYAIGTSTWADSGPMFVVSPEGGQPRMLEPVRDATRRFAWSPDGSKIAYQSASGRGYGLSVVRADGSEIVSLVSGQREEIPFTWLPDSRRILYGMLTGRRRAELRVADLASGATQKIYAGELPAFALSPDGKLVALGEYGGRTILTITTDGRRSRRLKVRLLKSITTVEWSPDGSRLAVVAGGALFTFKADGTRLRRLTSRSAAVSNLIWSPDGKRIAYMQEPIPLFQQVYLVRPNGRGCRRLSSSDKRAFSYRIAWSPRSDRLLFDEGKLMDEDAGMSLYLTNANGSRKEKLRSDAGPMLYSYGEWSPDGRQIALEKIYNSEVSGSTATVGGEDRQAPRASALRLGVGIHACKLQTSGTTGPGAR